MFPVSSYKIKGEGGTRDTRSIIHLRLQSRRSTQSRTPFTDIHQKRTCCNGGLLLVQMTVADPEGFHRFPLKPPLLADNVAIQS